MSTENAYLDDNSRNTITALANDGSGDIFNVRINPITGALVCEGNVTSGNTSITSTIPGGTAGSVLFLDIGGTLAQDNAHFFYDPINHRLALGHTTPLATLDILGTFKYADGSEHANYVLISDASGNATWDNLATNNTFISNLIANNTFTTNLANNSNFYTTLSTNNTFVTDLTSNTTFQTNVTNYITTGGGVLFETNGTPNGSQAILNLVQSGAVTITDDGLGNITIDASGIGSGTVTDVSVVTANGISGTVATSTTTPAITLALGAITPSSVNGNTITTGTGTLTLGAGITLTVSDSTTLDTNAITLGGGEVVTFSAGNALSLLTTGSTVMTFPATTDTVVTLAETQTITNKRITKRVLPISGNFGAPAIDTDNYDVVHITNQTVGINFSTFLTGTPVDGDTLRISITGTGAVALTWGASFESSTVTLPTTTVSTNRLDVGFFWNTETSKWRCVGSV